MPGIRRYPASGGDTLQCKCSIQGVSWDGQSISGVCTYSVSGYMRTYCSLHMCSIPLGWDSIPVVSKEYPGMDRVSQVSVHTLSVGT